MSSVQPVQSNDGFSKVENLDKDALSLLAAQHRFGLTSLQVTTGYFTPTAAGNYAVVDNNGRSIQFPPTTVLLASYLKGSSTLTGGTNVDVGGAATEGGATVTSMSGGAKTTALLTAADGVTNALGYTISGGNTWLSATTTGTYTAGTVKVVITWINAVA